MKEGVFSLSERITVFAIFLIGLFLTLVKYFQIVDTGIIFSDTINHHTFKSVIYDSGYLEFIPPIILTIGSIYLYSSASKIAWRITYLPLVLITIYFSYNVLLTVLSNRSADAIIIIEVFSLGFLISLNLILLLFCYFLLSENFKKKLLS